MEVPTAAAIAQTKAAIEAHLSAVRSHRDQRAGAHPYYRFHPIGQPIYGTVLMFHGFSRRPHQMWRLADYLFNQGFNVYQVTLAGHDRRSPEENWPRLDLRPEYAEPLKAKFRNDRVLQSALALRDSSAEGACAHQAAILQRLLEVAPELIIYAVAIARPDHPDFGRYFISSHGAFLENAQARLAELAALPDPIFTVGLSVGGTVALGLAATAQRSIQRPIQRVVAYAPLLQTFGADCRQYVRFVGPLDMGDRTGWDADLQFPLGALTAADYLGSQVTAMAEKLRSTPTFVTLTENEDAADIEAIEQFFGDIGGFARGHRKYRYPAAARVPHPMIDPTETSQGMRNSYWQSLYQETFRFLTTGDIEVKNLASLSQAAELPLVPEVSSPYGP